MLALLLNFILLIPSSLGAPADQSIYAPEDKQYCPSFEGTLSAPIKGEDLPDDGSVWRVGTNRWNEDWEQQYSNWITSNVNPDFMEVLNISTDCTDAVIVIRAIFSRIHSLPFILQDDAQKLRFDSTTFKNEPTLTDWNETNWKVNVTKDKRFNSFLSLIKNEIGSVNLPESEYPKRIHSLSNSSKLSPSIQAGTVFQYPEHTSFLARVNANDPYSPLIEYASTSGIIVRMLDVYTTPMIQSSAPGRGVMGFRWPVNCGSDFTLAPSQAMPDYSLEQYTLNLNGVSLGSYLESIAPGNRNPPDSHYVDLKLAEIKEMIIRRINLIDDAKNILQKNSSAFSDSHSNLYNQYSTNDLDVGRKFF